MNSTFGSAFGEVTFTTPATSRSISQRIARTKSTSWIHETSCRPSPTVPPRPHRTRPRRVNPLAEWEEVFDGADVSGDAGQFPPFVEVLAQVS